MLGARTFNRGRGEIPHCADILHAPAALAGAFDVLLGIFVLHHLKSLDDSFAAMRRLLKPHGRMVFLEANAYNPLFYLQIALTRGMTWEGDKGIAQMRPGRIFRAMSGAGLHRFEIRRFGFLPASLADRAWGSPIDAFLERVPVAPSFQLFQGGARRDGDARPCKAAADQPAMFPYHSCGCRVSRWNATEASPEVKFRGSQ